MNKLELEIYEQVKANAGTSEYKLNTDYDIVVIASKGPASDKRKYGNNTAVAGE